MQSLLELEDVTYVYHSINGETYALSNISFQVEDGEFIAIVGPSGCGKSTLLSLISGLLTQNQELSSCTDEISKTPKQISAICFRKIIYLNGAPFTVT